jgi:hypothetical protein
MQPRRRQQWRRTRRRKKKRGAWLLLWRPAVVRPAEGKAQTVAWGI